MFSPLPMQRVSLQTLREAAPNAETVRAAATAAEFLARWMEE